MARVAGFAPDILHGHDWQAGLAMAYLAYGGGRRRRPCSPCTISPTRASFRPTCWTGCDCRRRPSRSTASSITAAIGFLKAGLQFADRITTVSPTYAREIQSAAGGCGLEGLLRARAGVLSGIRNGIDVDVWNPETDNADRLAFQPLVAARTRRPTRRRCSGGSAWRRIRTRLLFGVVSRLAWHKGIDILADAMPALIGRGGAAGGAGNRRARAGAPPARAWPTPIAARSDASSAMTRIWRI